MTSPQDDRSVGLRERKKARTRNSIQAHAIRLFNEQGYGDTTVEQIAEAAEVSPSTFFRYFPIKEESVLYDSIDPILIASFLSQPAELSPLAAIRIALRQINDELSPDESELETMRHRLIMTVPELRSRLLERLVDTLALLTDAVAQRVGLDPDDPRVQVFTGAVIGTMLVVVYPRPGTEASAPPPGLNDEMLKRIDESLALLEDGLPL